MPQRGAVALVTTVLSVLLLITFKPAEQTGPPSIPPVAVVDTPNGLTAAGPTPTPQVAGPQPAPTQQSSSGGGSVGKAASPTPAPTDTPASGDGSSTITGDAIQTFYGTVQIALQVQGGQIIDVQELQMPHDRRLSAQISAEAGPLLRQEVLQAQSANIHGVSGASYTSYGFYLSLESALSRMS